MLTVLLFGILFFTLAEYLTHRYVFHSDDYTNAGKWQFKIHGIHHATPSDEERLAMPLRLSITLSSIFFFFFWLVMGNYAYFFFPGFLLGYSSYLSVHYLIHLRRPPKNIFRILWQHHSIHHFKNDREDFGVTIPLWDIVFGTMPATKKK
jgi:4-hydroxysphinganine ceramide fatty acyl 2-hydroxylase